jgi:adenylate kinase
VRSAETEYRKRIVISRLVILGAPGVGKGTQAKRIAEKHGWAHISTGDMLRKAIKDDSPLGNRVKSFVEKGDLVPDDLMIELVDRRLDESDCAEGFILDGFPRTVVQAEAMTPVLNRYDFTLQGVISIEVTDEEIVNRLSRRFICESCGAMEESSCGCCGSCSKCGGKLVRRKDDEPDTVRYRLKVYRDQTSALIAYYKGKGMLLQVDGTGSIDEVSQRVFAAIGSEAGKK